MTKVEQIFYNDKLEAVKKAKEEIARKLLGKGVSEEIVAECTGINFENVEELAAQLNVNV